MQADLRRIVAAAPGRQHGAARPVRDRRRGAGRRPRAVRGEDPRAARARCRRRWTGSRSRCAGPGADERSSWFTFRPGRATGEPVEDRTLRGLHPMVAERLGCGGCRNFELTRLPSPIDVHLFRAVGRNVPDDRRLVALSDVRDLSVRARRARPGPGAAAARARPRRLPGRPARGPGRRPAPTRGRTGTGCCSTSGRWWTCRSPSSTAWSAGWRRAPRGWGWSRSSCSSGCADPRRRRAAAPRGAEGAAAAAVPAAGRRARRCAVTDAARAARCASWTPTRRR